MTSNRKRRFSEFGDSLSLGHDSRQKRRRREEVNSSRDNRTRRHSYRFGGREARDQDTRSQRRRSRGACEQRDRFTHDRGEVSEKRGGTSREEESEKHSEIEPIKYRALEEICTSNPPENGIVDLWNKRERFQALLASKEEIRLGLMQLVIHAIHLCCSTKRVGQFSEDLLRLVVEENFVQLHLNSFISRMLSFSSTEFQPFHVISRLADVFLEMLKRFGLDIVHSIPSAQLKETFVELNNSNRLNEADTLENKIHKVEALKKEVIRKQSIQVAQVQPELEPPSNFRDISVIPQAEDLSVSSKPFLRVNVVNRRYRDLEHYLDVHFRLLREDCVSPLRDGIMNLRKDYGSLRTSNGSGNKTAKDVHVYREVKVLYPVCSRKGMVYRIRFDSLHHSLRYVNWEKSKRFKFGCLLCLSADDFYTLHFATVESRDDLCRGELEVRFEGVELEDLAGFIEAKVKFDMVESPTFFEAYRHVLEALKEIEPDGMPFQEHIVKCSKKVGPPAYERITNGYYDMSSILQGDWAPTASSAWPYAEEGNVASTDQSGDFDDYSMDSNDDSSPSNYKVNINDLLYHRESLELNDSQLRAFQMALTRRFAVIQGPPGTGKTYVGLKIAQVLLHTTALWENEEERAPILMVSYTNHALDQFLEGLLPMTGIVRVGGRSKSNKLEPYFLKFLREQARESKETPGRILRARTKANRKMREINENGGLELSTTVLKFSRRGVLSYIVLKQFMSERHVKWFESDKRKSPVDMFCEWLGVERRDSRKGVEDSRDDGFDNEDFQMQVSLRNYADESDVEDEEESMNINPSEVVICEEEDAEKPTELRGKLQDEETMSEEEEMQVFFLQGLSEKQRWRLYRLWLERAFKHHLQQVQSNQPEYEKAWRRLNELISEEDFHVLQKSRVIGMTTTCAARYRHILQRLHVSPKIVLVEEAAEVLEAHIISSLTKGCQHLILIGDHQQLRPSPSVYELAKKYKLDVSLFERMITVGIPCERLSVQHRMRPEIAALMKHIYPDLENHESVEKYEDIKGMKKNMFFVNHSFLEKSNTESLSHTNEHEARFLVSLCRYLLQQGYKAEQITILTTYSGQMFTIRDCLRNENDHVIKTVRLTTVDNFQGEENDVILLSLVRSNKKEKVGFIKIVNRACVALSRARMGFFCIGNFELLSKYSEIWSKIVTDLKASGSTGNALPLACQIHRTEVFVKTARDFKNKVPNGGCLRPCKVRLECGHACKKSCHPYDIEHVQHRCGEPCRRKIHGCTHLCPKLCCEECEKYCIVPVQRRLPLCGHIQTMDCSKDPTRVECKTPCEKPLLCTHRCQETCGKPCTKQCKELVKRNDWPCRHEVTVACSTTPADCPVPCGAILNCDHQCSGKCGECRMGRVHKRCKLRCGRLLVCSHVCREACVMSCPPCSRKCENRCIHSECNKQCGEPCNLCLENCTWACDHYKCSKLCGELCDRPRCDEPCQKALRCGSRHRRHICHGMCGEPCICSVCDVNDGQQITEIFFGTENEEGTRFIKLPDCQHIFPVAELDRYMDSPDDDGDNFTNNHVIKMKTCPRCSTPIRTSLRYGNVIKQRLQDIAKVKIAAYGNPQEINGAKRRLQARLTDLRRYGVKGDVAKDLERLERSVNRLAKGTMAAVTENQVTLMERYCAISERINQHLCDLEKVAFQSRTKLYLHLEDTAFKKELDFLRKRFTAAGVTERELREINLELTRQKLQFELHALQQDVRRVGLNLKSCYIVDMETVRSELSSGRLVPDRRLDELLAKLSAIRRNYRYLSPLTEEEKKEIVSAMNLSQGRWYKCPRGHVYTIGGCGQAMQRSSCPECGLVIGGSRHRLFQGNTEAYEMSHVRNRFGSRGQNTK